MVTRIDKYLGGLGIDATGKLEVTDNAAVVIGNGSTTGNVYAGTINSGGVELRSNDYATLLSARSNDGATLNLAYSNDGSTLGLAYSNDGSTLATARANDFNTYSVVLGGITAANTAILNLQTGLTGVNTNQSSNIAIFTGAFSGSNTRLSGAESNISALQSAGSANIITGINGTNTNLSGNVAIFTGAFTGSNTRLAGTESNVIALQGGLSGANTAITAKDTVANVYATWNYLNSNVIALQGGLSGANTINTTQATAITNLTAGLTGANTAIAAITSSPVTFQSNVTILGNLTLAGNTTIVSANTISFGDTLLSLGANNTTSDNLDIGLYGHYWNGTANSHSGIFRSAVSKDWMIFANYTIDLDGNSTVTISNSSFQLGTLRLANANAGFNVSAANAILGTSVFSGAVELRANDYATYLMAKGGVDAANTAIALRALAASPTLTGNATFDTNTLFVDSVNKRVGLITTLPGFTLDVRGTANTGALTSTTVSSNGVELRANDYATYLMALGGLSGANTNITALTGGLSGANTNITALTGGLSGANTNITALTGGLSGANTTIATKADSVGTANQILYKNASNVLTGSNNLIYDGTNFKVSGNMESLYSSGDEGGEIFLNKPVTNTSINTGVRIDIYQNRLRFWENGGTNRGAYIDITAATAGVGSNLLAGSGGSETSNVIALQGGLAGANTAIATKAPTASPTFTGSATFDTNTFYVDGTNDRVGVLTTAPGYSLDVRGAANVGALTATSINIIPAGSIIMFGANTAPSGWLVCDGTAVSRTTYSSLFTTIATNYGVGDNSTTFNLPDFRGRSPHGVDALQSITIGGTSAGKINSSYQNSSGTGTTGTGTTGSGTTGTSTTAITATTSNATTTTASSTSTGTTGTGTGTIPAATYTTGSSTTGTGTTGSGTGTIPALTYSTGTGTTGSSTTGTGTTGSGTGTIPSLTYTTGTGSTGTGTTGTSTTGTGTGTIPTLTYTTGTGTTGTGTTGTGTSGSTADTNTIGTSTTNSTTDKDVTNAITVVTSVTPIAHTHSIPGLSVPGLSVPALAIPAMNVAVPGLSVPGLSVPALSVPALTIPAMNVAVPGLSVPALTVPGLSIPALTIPAMNVAVPGLSIPALTVPALTIPAMNVAVPGLSIPALTIPSLTVTSHTHNVPALTIPGLSMPGLSIPGLSVPALTVTHPATIVQFIIKT